MSHNLIQLRRRRADFSPTDNALAAAEARDARAARDHRRGRRARSRRRRTSPRPRCAASRPTTATSGTERRGRDAREGLQGHGLLRRVRRRVGRLDGGGARPRARRDERGRRGLARGRVLPRLLQRGPDRRGRRAAIYGELTPETREGARADLGERRRASPEAHDALVPPLRGARRPGDRARAARAADRRDRTSTSRARTARSRASRKALAERTPDEVLAEVERVAAPRSRRRGLRDRARSGASPPRTRANAGEAYVVCNADEGDPGSYIDKYLMERDPFAVLEGIALAATRSARRAASSTCAASTRARRRRCGAPSTPRARRGCSARTSSASTFSFDVEIVEGAGSYVCGEETALLRSLEGLRGMVTARPPYPADKGPLRAARPS